MNTILKLQMIILIAPNYMAETIHRSQYPASRLGSTPPSHRDWMTIDYKHTLQSIRSTLDRSTETYPTTLSHRD